MKEAITIRLEKDLERRLDEVVRRTGRTRSEIVREALRRQLALMAFDDLRERTMPYAETAGFLTDEDVFREIS
ncbi:MAG: ribbon-helix-helix protein, CopG family [Gemmatimonadota bacterium]